MVFFNAIMVFFNAILSGLDWDTYENTMAIWINNWI